MRTARALAAALALLVAGATAAWPQADSLDEEGARRRELEEIQRRARENREAARRLKPQETQAIGQLRRSERQLSLTRRRLGDLTRRRRNLDLQLEVTRIDLQRNVQSLASQRDRLAHRLREIYKFGPARELEFILSTNSFAQLLTRWDFLVMLAEQDRQILESVRDRKETVETLERRLEGHLDQVARTARQTSSENKRLATQRQQRASAVREIRTQRQGYEAAATELERTARSIQQVLARLERRRREEAERARTSGKPPAPYTGDFARAEGSLDWPASGQVVGRFGPERNPRFPKVEIMNNGIDIAVPIGTAVRAVAKGKVDYVSGDYGTYGQMVIINHGDSYYTLYAHLNAIGVSVGDEVKSGQTIGRSGDTGSLKGPILHFEVRRGAAALNPEQWLR